MALGEGPKPLKIFLVAGEHSGDALGAKLIKALANLHAAPIIFAGVGGEEMAHEGFRSLFPIEDVAVMGPLSILPKLPRILRRVYQTVDAAVAFAPDVVVIIDSPEFTHPIAKRIRKRAPNIPIIDYVSPSVWAWRPGRAKKMRRLRRSCSGAAAVRAGGARASRRPAVHLCRPSADREARRYPECRWRGARARLGSRTIGRCFSSCPAAGRRKSGA